MRKAFPCQDVVMLAEYRSHWVAYYRSQHKIIKEKNVCTSKRAIYVTCIIQQSIANLPVQRTYLYDVALPDPANNHPLFVKWPRGVLMSHMTSNLIACAKFCDGYAGWQVSGQGYATRIICLTNLYFKYQISLSRNFKTTLLSDMYSVSLVVDARLINTHNSTIGSLSNSSCTQHLPSVISWDIPIIHQSSITP